MYVVNLYKYDTHKDSAPNDAWRVLEFVCTETSSRFSLTVTNGGDLTISMFTPDGDFPPMTAKVAAGAPLNDFLPCLNTFLQNSFAWQEISGNGEEDDSEE